MKATSRQTWGIAGAMVLAAACWALAGPPMQWVPRGAGGSGAFYGPSISPHNPDELFVRSDRSEYFHSVTAGRLWETLDFRAIQGGSWGSPVQFTSDPNRLYALNHVSASGVDVVAPVRSRDGGRTWEGLPTDPTSGNAFALYADPQSTERLVLSSEREVFFSDDGGTNFVLLHASNNCHVAGACFDGPHIFVGTRDGLFVSTNNGGRFDLASVAGIPASEQMVSFAGAAQSGTTRLFCVTAAAGSSFARVTGAYYLNYAGLYRLDYGISPQWTRTTNGIVSGVDYPFFVATCRTNVMIAYAAGGTAAGCPGVWRTADGGASWQPVFQTLNNANLFTGWQGDGGDRSWNYGGCALGLAVGVLDPRRALLCDRGGVHLTTNAGSTWQQAYLHAPEQNPTNAPTPRGRTYHGVGLENGTCWSLTWWNATNLFAACSDIGTVRSRDGGVTWSLNASGLSADTCLQILRHPGNGWLLASLSSVRDLFQSSCLNDTTIDGGTGGICYSEDDGATWSVLYDAGHPVAGLALHPSDANVLYACVVHSTEGGIYVTSNLLDGAGSTWTPITNGLSRTAGHPYTVRVLDDGTLVCSYSGRQRLGSFTASSGVFVSTNGGASWLDRTDEGMKYWTKDLVVDPHDPAQQTWYAGVFTGWGTPPYGTGGLYRTSDRGVTWTRLSTASDRVESCAVNPHDPDEILVTTEAQGLWLSTNATADSPDFWAVTNYPFRHPLRVYYAPTDTNEIWVTSFGNGLRLGRFVEPRPVIASMLWTASAGRLTAGVTAAPSQELLLETGTNLIDWQAIATNTAIDGSCELSDPQAGGFPSRYYRIRVK